MQMLPRIRACAFVLTVGWVAMQFAQGPPILHKVGVISLNEQATLTVFPIKSDLEGNIYIRLYETGKLGGGPILKVSSDGKETVRFSLDGQGDVGTIQDFSPGTNGELFMLTRNREQHTFVLKYSSEGNLDTTETVERRSAILGQMAVFSSGDLLLGGKEDATSLEKGSPPFWGIFNSRGQLLKKLAVKPDDQLSNRSPNRTSMSSLVNAELADDGNVYAMRFASPCVQIISPSGNIRTLVLETPKGARLTSLKVAKDRLAAMFTERKEGSSVEIAGIFLRVYDAESGKLVAEYQASRSDFGLGLATYAPDVFTFLGSDENGKMQLQRGSPN
jgi:hypothetical protein